MYEKGLRIDGREGHEELTLRKARFALEQTQSKLNVLLNYRQDGNL